MPMCDMYIPEAALDADAENALVRGVSDLLVQHEVRRMDGEMRDPEAAAAALERAKSIAWMFVHRNETWVAGEMPDAPYYKFEVSIPEGIVDDEYRESVATDITSVVAEAEGARAEDGNWPHVAARVWVFTYEVPDGSWGAAGQSMRLGQIVDYVSLGMGDRAEQRFADTRRAAAIATVALAEGERVIA